MPLQGPAVAVAAFFCESASTICSSWEISSFTRRWRPRVGAGIPICAGSQGSAEQEEDRSIRAREGLADSQPC
jgi:hypothetical protein